MKEGNKKGNIETNKSLAEAAGYRSVISPFVFPFLVFSLNNMLI